MRDDVEDSGLTNHQVVAALVDRVSFRDPDAAFAAGVAGQTKSADDAVAMQGLMVQTVLAAEIALIERQVGIGQQLATEVGRPGEALEAAIAGAATTAPGIRGGRRGFEQSPADFCAGFEPELANGARVTVDLH